MKSEETIFAEALEKATEQEREAYLVDACGGDAKLRESIDSLLLRARARQEVPPIGAGRLR